MKQTKEQYIISSEVMGAIKDKYPNAYYAIMYDSGTIKKNLEIKDKLKNSCRVVSKKMRYDVLKRQNWRCNICSCNLKYDKNSKFGDQVAHIDHIHPYSKRVDYPNGIDNINEVSNLQALCPSCNIKKSSLELQ